MSTLLTRKLMFNSFKRSIPSVFIADKSNNKYVQPYYYNQTRNLCFPVVMLGGCLGSFCVTQMWNPNFDRSVLATLQIWSVGLTIIGFILPN